MRMEWEKLKGMRVETQSGVVIGRVHSLVFEIEGQLIAQYVVWSSRLKGRVHIVNRDQVVRFTADCLVVSDNVEKEAATPDPIPANPAISPQPAMRKTLRTL